MQQLACTVPKAQLELDNRPENMWAKLGSRSKSFVAGEVEFLDLCKQNVRIIEDFANGGNLLNQRQCQDLSSKLLRVTHNIRELVVHSGASAILFRPALETLHRCLEKAKVLVSECGKEDWCTAAVCQIQNENAFREIVLGLGFCYNAIYELAKATSDLDLPEDLRESPVVRPASDYDVVQDQQDLQKRLEDLANEPCSSKLWDQFLPGKRDLKQRLARYLLLKLSFTAEQSQGSALDVGSAILWRKDGEPSGTWGNYSCFLGAGAGASGVCSTKWMGMRCAKKQFHNHEGEILFLKEAGILAHLKHPCIVNFFCCGNGMEKGDRFIAMELMEKSLFDLIEEQKGSSFSLDVAVDMMVQIASGMCYMHGRGVAHRDLKPSNVVVNRLPFPHSGDHFRVKLVDFGVSKIKVEVSKSDTVTAHGIGTTMYRAPEAHPDAATLGSIRKVNWLKADVFSFAMTCSHILSLKIPFQGMLRDNLYNKLINGHRPKLPTDCPCELVALLGDCWNANPSLRPSFIEVYTRLESFQYKLLKGLSTFDQDLQEGMELNDPGLKFIKEMVKEQYAVQKPFIHDIDDDVEGETCNLIGIEKNGLVSLLQCNNCNRALEFLSRSTHHLGEYMCDICWEDADGEVYSCKSCEFDVHPQCAKIEDKVNVFFHGDTLHLLVQNYYDDNPDVICGFCEQPLQGTKWVYTCKQCNFDVHAMCTKYPRKVEHFLGHSHPLTLVQSSLSKDASCKCCNCSIKGYHYTCTQKWCAFELHPLCIMLPWHPLCIFDRSHRLSLRLHFDSRLIFYCGKCGALGGFSRSYWCKDCGVSIHVECVIHDTLEDDWNRAYEKFILEYGNKAHCDQMGLMIELLDMLSVSNGLESNSSSCPRPPPVTMRVQPMVPIFDEVELKRKIGAETEERKAEKMVAKQKVRAGHGVKLDNLERLLQSSNIDHAGVFAATKAKLRKLQDSVQEEITSKARQVPRIGLFYIDYSNDSDNNSEDLEEELNTLSLMSSLSVTHLWGVRLVLLCEEPGHEHIVRNAISGHDIMEDMVGEQVQKLQPLLASGLQVVRMALRRAPHIADLSSVTLPSLGEKSWDLRSINVNEEEDFHSKMAYEDATMAEEHITAAESLRSYFEDNDIKIFDTHGLVRIRYTTTEQGDCPQYKRGTVAWLCTEHQNRGLEAGILEPYPLRIYHNFEYDQQRQYL